MLKKLLGLSIAAVAAFAVMAGVASAQAVLKNARVVLSDPTSAAVATSHTYQFFHPASNLGFITLDYCINASGTCTDTGVNFIGSAYTAITKGGNPAELAEWSTAPSWNAGTFRLSLERDSQDGAAGTTEYVFTVNGVTNPSITNCTQPANGSTGTCYVRITTYQNTSSGSTVGAQSTVSVTVTRAVTVTATVDPSFTLIVSGVRPSQTAAVNSTTLTNTVTTTVTTIPFGNLQPLTPKYAAQSLTVTTNAFGGYSVTARMAANMTGTAYGSEIDPFIGNSAAYNSQSASWTSPTGTASGTETGWLGVGPADTTVPNRGANQFFPLGTTAQTVANLNTSAQNRISAIAYAIEVNAYQQADSYTGTLRYNALPVY